MKSLLAAGLLAALAAVPVASAQADVIYSVTQTSPTFGNPASGPWYKPTVPLTTNLLVIVTDEAAAQGFSASYDGLPPLGGTGTAPAGIVDIVVQVFDNGSLYLNWNLDRILAAPGGINVPNARFSFSAVADGLLSGGLYLNNTDTLITYALNGTSAVTGTVGSDRTQACSYGGCTFTATQSRTAVPEPMSIALFGAGLAGLAVARRRKV